MQIVIVGGGAGGLELATKLGKKLGRRGKADILLIDRNHTHIWKPLLHEVASGSLDADLDAVSYRAHAHRYGFRFELGTLCGIDRVNRCIRLASEFDEEGQEILPARERHYDRLVLAIGSVSNDFRVPGVREHCIFLDSPNEAYRFHQRLVNGFMRLNQALEQSENKSCMEVVIVGGGATGVELSAELCKAREWFATYGLSNLTVNHFRITLIEAGPRLLPALNEHIAEDVQLELKELGVRVMVETAVVAAHRGKLTIKDQGDITADMMVWAAGVKAPDFLCDIDGLETNRANQLLVDATLKVQGDAAIYALGDCAGCLLLDRDAQQRWVPPRAQSAHQMATTVYHNLFAECQGAPLKSFRYKDMGSLVSLSEYNAFGRLMGGLARNGLSVEGRLARLAYVSLYRLHQAALHGWFRTLILALGDKINHFVRPRFKLH